MTLMLWFTEPGLWWPELCSADVPPIHNKKQEACIRERSGDSCCLCCQQIDSGSSWNRNSEYNQWYIISGSIPMLWKIKNKVSFLVFLSVFLSAEVSVLEHWYLMRRSHKGHWWWSQTYSQMVWQGGGSSEWDITSQEETAQCGLSTTESHKAGLAKCKK